MTASLPLAYVFWHWPRSDVDRAEYETRLAEFHATLRRNPPAGFLGSGAYRGGPCPWGNTTGPTYEDWYLTEGTEALDPLERGAVDAVRGSAHDGVAQLAAGGAAGLYRLRLGAADPATARAAAWFHKPQGMTYAALDELLGPIAKAAGVGLWMRKMVLGPTPEFCVLSSDPIRLPAAFRDVLSRPLEMVRLRQEA